MTARDAAATARAVDKSPDRIAGMFDAIAPRYDLLNRLLSAGIDRRWRARAVRSLALTGRETLVDVCAGTADVALEAVGGAAPGCRARDRRGLCRGHAGARASRRPRRAACRGA